MQVRLALCLVLLSAAACADEPKRPVAPTAPPAAVSAAVVPHTGLQVSTVCLSYARDQALARAELKDKPTSERLQKRVAAMDRLIQDACQ